MVKLPDTPQGHELEEYVAAYFQTSGYYVDKNITEDNVLELDVVTTDYASGVPSGTLIEVKSGTTWGFSDLFKVFGWMHYLSIPRGALFATAAPPDKDLKFIQGKGANSLGVAVVCVEDGDLQKAPDRFAEAGFSKVGNDQLVTMWRFSFWLERRLISQMRKEVKKGSSKAASVMLEYYRLINDGVFLEPNVAERAHALYSAYRDHPKLTASVAAEINGGTYDQENPVPADNILKQAIYQGMHPLVQASMFLEHRARLSLIKAAVDYLALSEGGMIKKTRIRGATGVDDLWFELLPKSFRAGAESLKGRPYRQYPFFWQVFLWNWGGFMLKDRIDEETKVLAKQTGLQPEEIPIALSTFDTFFPRADGRSWLVDGTAQSQIRLVRMVPTPFQGLGAFQRMVRYGIKDYSELGYKDYTTQDLVKWHNAAVALLKS
jgi:hypothetical protein